jgi:hypothetical protein
MRRHVLSSSFTLLLLVAALVTGCGDDDSSGGDGGTDQFVPMEDASPPSDMGGELDEGVPVDMDTPVDFGPPCDGPPGLYVDPGCTILAEGIESFNPRYWLWTDGSDKQRYIFLPEGSQIDTTDPDNWVYPVGTRVWKNFLTPSGDTKLETRYFEKLAEGTGPDFWDIKTFVWDAAQTGVEEVLGGMENVLGTDHDIPSGAQCIECHASPGRADVLAGFTAIQLNHSDTGVSLDQLNLRGALSETISVSDAVVPSGGDSRYAAALGYFLANCGTCHGNDGARAGMKLWSNVGVETFEASDVATTAVGVEGIWALMGATGRIVPGNPGESSVLIRASSREAGIQMPPLGTEVADDTGQATIRAFIEALGE